jgi:hypothetical protein
MSQIGEINVTDAVAIFVDHATQFCKFVDIANSLPLQKRLKNLSLLLSRIYIAALELPDVEPSDRETEIPSVETPNISFDEVDAYWEVFDPYERGEPLQGSLADDVLDIYRDVKRGLLMYELATSDDASDAIWYWKFHFSTHWGFHVVDALRAIHWTMNT